MKTCEICGNSYNGGAAVCQSCKDKLEGTGPVVKRCDCELFYKGATRSKRCPSCDRKNRTQPCAVCGKSTFNNSRHFYEGGTITICSDCLATAPGAGKCVCKCESCGSIVKASNPFNICPVCGKSLRNKHLDALHKSMVSAGNCTVCDTYTDKRDGAGRFHSCASRQLTEQKRSAPGICPRCGNYSEVRSGSGLCIPCTGNFWEYDQYALWTEERKAVFAPHFKKMKENSVKTQKLYWKIVADNDTDNPLYPKAIEFVSNHALIKSHTFTDEYACSDKCYLYDVCDHTSPKNCFGICSSSPNLFPKVPIKELLYKIKDTDEYKNAADHIDDSDVYRIAVKHGISIIKGNNFTFDRTKFYENKFKVTSYCSVEEMVSDFDAEISVPGVWCIKDRDGDVLDVYETVDIGKEMYRAVRRLNYCKDKTDEELYNKNYNWRKTRDIVGCGKLDFIVVARGVEDKEERWKIEAQYAHNNKAKYWSPAPGQIID